MTYMRGKQVMKLKTIDDIIKAGDGILYDMKKRTCCFTGHRAQKLPWKFNENHERCISMKRALRETIEKTILDGYETFITGMALGFDMISAEMVLELKAKFKNIKLVAAIPCKTQCDPWPQAQQVRYQEILKKVDYCWYCSDKYTNTCMQQRNDYMLNCSSRVIALYNGLGGGTASTIMKAEKLGLDIFILKP